MKPTRRTLLQSATALAATTLAAGAATARPDSADERPSNEPGKPASITSASIRTTGSACGGEGGADLEVRAPVIRIAGTIGTSNPCHEAVFASLERREDALVVTIGATPTGGVCIMCLGEVEYEASVTLSDYSDVSSVVVVHESMGQSRVVARAGL